MAQSVEIEIVLSGGGDDRWQLQVSAGRGLWQVLAEERFDLLFVVVAGGRRRAHIHFVLNHQRNRSADQTGGEQVLRLNVQARSHTHQADANTQRRGGIDARTVCGAGHCSLAAITSIAPSMTAAPVIITAIRSWWPGASTKLT